MRLLDHAIWVLRGEDMDDEADAVSKLREAVARVIDNSEDDYLELPNANDFVVKCDDMENLVRYADHASPDTSEADAKALAELDEHLSRLPLVFAKEEDIAGLPFPLPASSLNISDKEIQRLRDGYEEVIAEARERLGDAFDSKDFPMDTKWNLTEKEKNSPEWRKYLKREDTDG